MNKVLVTLTGLCLFAACGADQKSSMQQPPVAKKTPKELVAHDDVRVDDYYWLKERESAEVIEYLEAENAYTEARMAHTEELQETLVDEFRGRIKQTDLSVPYRRGDYFYYSRTEDGKEYPFYCRKKGSETADEQVMLDVNQMAEGHGFYTVGALSPSPDQKLLAFAEDTVGRRKYTLRVKNLETGEMLSDNVPEITGNIAWAEDGKTIFYTKQEPDTLRWRWIYRHKLGDDASKDVLVYDETDETFNAFVYKSKSKQYILIGSNQTLASEYRYLDAKKPEDEFQVIEPRTRGHEYSVDHHGDSFWIVSNLEAKNFRLMRAPVSKPGAANWKEAVPHRDDTLLEDVEVFKNHRVLVERKDGLLKYTVSDWDGGGAYEIEFDEPAYDVSLTSNVEYDSTTLRYNYESPATPDSVYDYDLKTKERTLLKREEVGLGYDPAEYEVERLYAEARDGASVPISLVYKKPYAKDGSKPMLLYGYGSYGYSMDAGFSPYVVSLLDRGFVYAIAHIRGGQELGRAWYEDGRQLKKKNTFTDFIDSAEYLIAEGYADRERVFARGGSAGGLLMGAVMNMRPDLWKGVVSAVPFVDVITTMMDPSIPLTTGEYDEWGDPNKKEFYDYILSYSPYDQVEAKDYPNVLVTTGLHDSQVQYWEPAKWVAKLRDVKTDDNLLLLKTEMEAGHGGVTGRYKRYKETAFYYAFLLDLAGVS